MKWIVLASKEPLLHFLVLAGGLFVLSRVLSGGTAAEEPDTIVVSEQRIKSLSLSFQRTWQRLPTRQELDGLIKDYIKEEVFYREALAMGLDRDDTLIRRRLRPVQERTARRSVHHAIATADAEDLPSDPRTEVRAEKQDRIGLVDGFAKPAQRVGLDQCLFTTPFRD